MIREIRIHGRGGQGSVTAAEVLAHAAFFEGKQVQAFPYFGAERRGAPVKSFARISDEPILVHSQVYSPDYVIVLDPYLHRLVNVAEGLKRNGIVVVNTTQKPDEVEIESSRVATVDATGVALRVNLVVAGLPVVNTPILGAFSRATGEVKLESVLKAIRQTWLGSAGEKNAKAAELAYDNLAIGW